MQLLLHLSLWRSLSWTALNDKIAIRVKKLGILIFNFSSLLCLFKILQVLFDLLPHLRDVRTLAIVSWSFVNINKIIVISFKITLLRRIHKAWNKVDAYWLWSFCGLVYFILFFVLISFRRSLLKITFWEDYNLIMVLKK